jgi:SAM-dependent methyltransferase
MKNPNLGRFSEVNIGVNGFISSNLFKLEITNKDVLDVGCGYGWFLWEVAKHQPKSLLGIEISDQDLETAANDPRLLNVDLRVGNILSNGFADASFDLVSAWEVLEHIPKNTEQKMFNEIYRILRLDGTALLSTPNKDFRSIIFDPAFCFGHRHYSINQIRSYALNSGLNVEIIEVKGGWPQIIYMLNLYIAKWIFKREPFFLNYMGKILERDWKSTKGFSNIHCKLTKLVT